MNIGVMLPTFRESVSDALGAAELAQIYGLDGVFVYDHLWPMGAPRRPSLAAFPVLARLAVQCDSLMMGPLVARVGLVSRAKLVEEFLTLEMLAPGRVIAGLGTGDSLSEAENLAYGIAFGSASERREDLSLTIDALPSAMPVWVGGGSRATNDLARHKGATLNLWNRITEELRQHSELGPVSWAGDAREDLETQLEELSLSGVTWAVFSPSCDIVRLAEWRRGHFDQSNVS